MNKQSASRRNLLTAGRMARIAILAPQVAGRRWLVLCGPPTRRRRREAAGMLTEKLRAVVEIAAGPPGPPAARLARAVRIVEKRVRVNHRRLSRPGRRFPGRPS